MDGQKIFTAFLVIIIKVLLIPFDDYRRPWQGMPPNPKVLHRFWHGTIALVTVKNCLSAIVFRHSTQPMYRHPPHNSCATQSMSHIWRFSLWISFSWGISECLVSCRVDLNVIENGAPTKIVTMVSCGLWLGMPCWLFHRGWWCQFHGINVAQQ